MAPRRKTASLSRSVAPLRDSLKPRGRVEVFVTRGRPRLLLSDPLPQRPGYPLVHRAHELDFSGCQIVHQDDIENVIVIAGKNLVIESLASGFLKPIVRMAVGDRGAQPGDPTQPKPVFDTMTALYNEVYRDDVEATVITTTASVHEAKFIKTFSATIIPITAFSNQAVPVISEVGLITADIAGAAPLPRPPVAFPAAPDADEALFSVRTFKTVPFEAANDIAVTIRYTIFIE